MPTCVCAMHGALWCRWLQSLDNYLWIILKHCWPRSTPHRSLRGDVKNNIHCIQSEAWGTSTSCILYFGDFCTRLFGPFNFGTHLVVMHNISELQWLQAIMWLHVSNGTLLVWTCGLFGFLMWCWNNLFFPGRFPCMFLRMSDDNERAIGLFAGLCRSFCVFWAYVASLACSVSHSTACQQNNTS